MVPQIDGCVECLPPRRVKGGGIHAIDLKVQGKIQFVWSMLATKIDALKGHQRATNSSFQAKMKHIEVCHHFIHAKT